MKNHILSIFIILLLTTSASFACEICGCSNGNFQIGLLPNFNKGFMGIRYSYSHFTSQVKSDPTQFSNDFYKTVELWGGYSFKKMQVMAFLPYVISRKESDDGVTVSNGIGDLMLLVNYNIWKSTHLTKSEKTTIMHDLFIGGGVKLPTGVNSVNTTSSTFNIGDFNSQAGTGSVDYMVNATHNVMWNNSGIVTNVAYRINTANPQGYRFGNRAYVSSAYYYTFTKSSFKIKPNVGINYQSNSVNKYSGDQVADSNGYNFNATAGLNVLRKKIGANVMAFIPVSQNNFDGQTKLVSRFLVGMTYSF
jgi:hypothetical protein